MEFTRSTKKFSSRSFYTKISLLKMCLRQICLNNNLWKIVLYNYSHTVICCSCHFNCWFYFLEPRVSLFSWYTFIQNDRHIIILQTPTPTQMANNLHYLCFSIYVFNIILIFFFLLRLIAVSAMCHPISTSSLVQHYFYETLWNKCCNIRHCLFISIYQHFFRFLLFSVRRFGF